MTKKNIEKVIYLVTDNDKKSPLINLYSLPTKCPVCHSFQEPKLRAVNFKDDNDAWVQFSCLNNKCKSSFTAFYFKGSHGNEQFHFLCFL
ncbi:hypothetical protein [Robertmurraya korlensis]|uniref:hypothetical protein n=1 Tax=Robertmurraya korlensis TaxID=519977 RepID=UPI000824186F|nr:hypothetical protein [Robertmurraya korlensis]